MPITFFYSENVTELQDAYNKFEQKNKSTIKIHTLHYQVVPAPEKVQPELSSARYVHCLMVEYVVLPV
jgi:hypothetical protein